jgi:hypothetical protein
MNPQKTIICSLIGAAIISVCAAFNSAAPSPKYEYKVIGPQANSWTPDLNQSGKEGWELVSVTQARDNYTFYLKRVASEK